MPRVGPLEGSDRAVLRGQSGVYRKCITIGQADKLQYVADRLLPSELREDHGCHRIITEFSQDSHSVCSDDET